MGRYFIKSVSESGLYNAPRQLLLHCPTTVLPVHELWLQTNLIHKKFIVGPLRFFQKLHSVARDIVIISNIR